MPLSHPMVRRAMGDPPFPDGTVGVHGQLYDVSRFSHPGGDAFLALTEGRDATALFEAHHGARSGAAKRALDALPKAGSYAPERERDFAPYAALRERVAPLLRLPVPLSTRVARAGWVGAMLAAHAWLCLAVPFGAAWWAMIVVAAASNTVCGGVGHNALHRLEPEAVLLDWNGLSCFEWLLEHVASHHMETNSDRDHDVISMEPFLFWSAERPEKKGLLRGTEAGMHALFAISEVAVAAAGNFGHRVRWAALWDGRFPAWMRAAPLLYPARVASLVACQGAAAGGAAALLSTMAAGYVFSLLAHLNHGGAEYAPTAPTAQTAQTPPTASTAQTAQTAQTAPTAPRQGGVGKGRDAELPMAEDFLLRQLRSTRDFPPLLHGADSLSLGLDRQTLHHLFPAADHALLTPLLRAEVKAAVGEREGVRLDPEPISDLYASMAARVAEPPQSNDKNVFLRKEKL